MTELRIERPDPDTILITIDRPHRANSLDSATLEAMLECLTTLREDAALRAVVFAGGGRWFISGADIHYLASITREEFATFADLVVQLFRLIRTLPMITMARIDGAAMGIGLTLAFACDIRVATAQSPFGHPEATLGFVGGTALLPRYSALPALARWRLLSGSRISAEEAMRMGLLTQLAGSTAELDAMIYDFIAALRPIDRDCLVAVKRSIYETEAIADPATALATQQEAAIRRFDPTQIHRAFETKPPSPAGNGS